MRPQTAQRVIVVMSKVLDEGNTLRTTKRRPEQHYLWPQLLMGLNNDRYETQLRY